MGPYGERLAFLDEHDALLNALAAGVACIRRGADGHWVQIDTHETDTEAHSHPPPASDNRHLTMNTLNRCPTTEDDEEYPLVCATWVEQRGVSVLQRINAVPSGRTHYY